MDRIRAGRLLTIIGVGTISAALVLGIKYLASGELDWGDSVSGLVTLVATTFVIVALLEREERRRWAGAEGEDSRSVVFLSLLAASGWPTPRDIEPEDLQPAKAREELRRESAQLAESSRGIDAFFKLTAEQSELELVIDLPDYLAGINLYDLEGTRRRRIDYLTALVTTYLPSLIERRRAPALFTRFVAVRQAHLALVAAADHVDTAVSESILVARPEILRPYLAQHPESITADKIALLKGALKYVMLAYDPKRVERILKGETSGHDSVGELGFLRGCAGHVRNEMEWAAKSLELVEAILASLEPHLTRHGQAATAELLKLNLALPHTVEEAPQSARS